MNLIPTFDKILVVIRHLKPLASGLVLPDKSQNHESQMPYCEVIAIGPDCTPNTKVGDKVIILPGNLVGFVDPRQNAGPQDVVLLTSEQNVMGKYVEEDTAVTLN